MSKAPQLCPNSNLGHLTRQPIFNWPGHPSLLGPLTSPILTPASWEAQFFWGTLSQQERARPRPRDPARVMGAMGVCW